MIVISYLPLKNKYEVTEFGVDFVFCWDFEHQIAMLLLLFDPYSVYTHEPY